ncbi:hypothetical protein E24_00378 [Faustovirus]|nr:hypothetical protein PRJ_Fausto_00355 [Faustovirus]AMN83294.1 hypothetical protein E24_00378 [Faustovirus]AMN84279.1 hypothetical protein D5a_00377 [Faustovirus]AMN85265.1 hypothetical protein E23_00378 [Faustovirus]QBR99262.1 hypothetical protein [Faustovirus mariensis]
MTDNSILDYKIDIFIKYKLFKAGEIAAKVATYICIAFALIFTLKLCFTVFSGVANIVYGNQLKPTGMFYCEPDASRNSCINPSCGRGIDYFELNAVRSYIAKVNSCIKSTGYSVAFILMSTSAAYFMWLLQKWCRSEANNWQRFVTW